VGTGFPKKIMLKQIAAQLSPCHNQNSLPDAAFCGNA
jgi:hypothetical protein